MQLEGAIIVLLVTAAIDAKVQGSFEKKKNFEGNWISETPSKASKDESPPAYSLNEIKWPDILVTSGTATQVSDARKLSGRKAWCQSRQFLLDLTAPDCSTRRVAAKFCHGQCTSVYVPHGGGSFRSCPSCAPVNGRWASVTLSCHGGSTNRVEKFFRVKKCRCKEPQQ